MQSSGKPQKNDVESQTAKVAVTEEKKPSEGKLFRSFHLSDTVYSPKLMKLHDMILMVVVCRDRRCCKNMLQV